MTASCRSASRQQQKQQQQQQQQSITWKCRVVSYRYKLNDESYPHSRHFNMKYAVSEMFGIHFLL